MEKAFEISVPVRTAAEQWQRFVASRGAGGLEPRFEPVAAQRTRVLVRSDAPQAEERMEEFRRFAQQAGEGLGGAAAAGNPGARGAAPGAAGGTMIGGTGGTPGAGGGKTGTTPGGTPGG